MSGEGNGGSKDHGEIPGLFPGAAFGDGFVLARKLGNGGMGEVWLARESKLGRDVALKILAERGGDAESEERVRKRFERESKILALSNHASILPIYRSGIDNATSLRFYATQACLVSREELAFICDNVLNCPYPVNKEMWDDNPRALSLADLIDGRKVLPESSVARIGLALVDAVAYAHSLSAPVIHRDIKPANILFRPDGGVVLSDFGVAKKIHADGSVSATLTTTSSERRGLFVGTFAYAAPEQQNGQPVTGATDYYSIGAVLYEALTGQRPRSLKMPSSFDRRHISPRWDKLLTGMLAPEPEERLADPVKITAELKAISKPHRRKLPWIAAAAILAALGAFAAAQAHGEKASDGGEKTFQELQRDFVRTIAYDIRQADPEVQKRKSGTLRVITLPDGSEMEFSWCWGPHYMFNSGEYLETEEPLQSIQTNSVLISKGFWMARTELTVAQAAAIMGDGFGNATNTLPAELTLVEALGIAIILNNLDIAGGSTFRLPSEAEWEYACRANSRRRFEGAVTNDICWSAENSGGRLHPVAQGKPNAWKLYDMHGNAPEWCSDGFAPHASGPHVMPHVKLRDNGPGIVKGGGYDMPPADCESHSRKAANWKKDKFGARLVLAD